MSDALLARVAHGDHDAFAQLYDVESGVVFGVILRIIRNRAHAQEVLQEVFLQVWQQAPRFEPEHGSARAWVLTIARRRAIDRVRTTQAATDRERRHPIDTVPYDSTSDTVLATIDQARVRRAMHQLTDLQRTALELAYFEGLSHAQLAARLRIPLGTAKARVAGGLAALRRWLDARDESITTPERRPHEHH